MLRITSVHFELWECQGWTSKRTHGAFKLDFWKTTRFRHGFPTDFWRRSSVTVCEAHILPLTKSMPIRTSEKVTTSRKKSHGALMLDLCRIFHCAWFRWYDSAAIPDWIWRRSRVIVSEGLCRSGHQRISMLRITLVHFELWECQGWTSKIHTVLSSWTSGRPADSVMDFRLTLEKVKRDCLRRLHLTSDKVNADQDIREGQNISKKSHGVFMLDLCRIFHYAWFRWHDSAWFRPFQKVTSHGFHHDLRPGGRLPRKCITECFRAGPAWKIQKQQPQVSSLHGTDGVWFQCRPQLWETTARLCFWDKFAFSINKTQETGVKICVHNRWIVDDKQKRSRWMCRSIHERSRKSS